MASSRLVPHDSTPLSNTEKALLIADLNYARVPTDRISAFLYKSLPRSHFVAIAKGARCWEHRNKSGGNADGSCTMQQCEMQGALWRTVHEIVIIHWQGLSVAQEPHFRCRKAARKCIKEGKAEKIQTYSAIRHSCSKFPDKPNTRMRCVLWRCGRSRGDCVLQAENPYTGELETVYQLTRTCFIALPVLIETNNYVFDHHKASPGMKQRFMHSCSVYTHLFCTVCAAAIRTMINSQMTSSFMTRLYPRDETLSSIQFNRGIVECFMDKQAVTNRTARIIFKALWYYQWLPTVGMSSVSKRLTCAG